MELDKAMIVAGVGCRKGASREDVAAAIASALGQARLSDHVLDVIATPMGKADEPGIVAAAAALRVRLLLIPERDFLAAGARTETHSDRVAALMGVPSVAEAAALAAAGPGARLLVRRVAIGPATCALATSGHP
jgi:cobalt-precorrin 5A hydrolase